MSRATKLKPLVRRGFKQEVRDLVARPSPSGRRWPEGPDEGTTSQEFCPSPGASRHPLSGGEGTNPVPRPVKPRAIFRTDTPRNELLRARVPARLRQAFMESLGKVSR